MKSWPIHFLLLLILVTAAGAEDGAPAPAAAATAPHWTHRITGLFSRDREADLRAALEQIPGVQLVSLDFEYAEGVFAYDPAVAFKETKPEKIVERFNTLLGNATRHTMGIAPLDPTPQDELARIEIGVSGLDCKACALAAYESIYKIAGVRAATVDFKAGRMTAEIDLAKTDRRTLEEALKKRGVTIKPEP
jgi:copper chaperone CopZ